MESINLNNQNEKNLAGKLFESGYLIVPEKCACKSIRFSIQLDNSNHTSGICFFCLNYLCQRKFQIRINSFFYKFPKIKMENILEELKSFLILEFNVEKAYNYLLSEKHITLSKPIIYYIYKEIRKVIYQYYLIVYETESLGVINGNQNYSVDESLFIHRNNVQIWLLGVIDNTSKDFRLEASFTRDSLTLEKFIKKYLETGNTVITDEWLGYPSLDSVDSCYQHIKHLDRGGDFWIGLESTSHIEGLWGILKSKIKSTYVVILMLILCSF